MKVEPQLRRVRREETSEAIKVQPIANPLEQAVEPAVSVADNREETDEHDDFDALYESWLDFQSELALGGMPPEVAD